jgi:hypothetical protein
MGSIRVQLLHPASNFLHWRFLLRRFGFVRHVLDNPPVRDTFFQALTHLDRTHGNKDFVLSLLNRCALPRYTNLSLNEVSTMRKAICHLDILWFRDAVIGSGVAKIKPANLAVKST